MICSWFFYDLFLIFSWLFMLRYWFVHDFLMDFGTCSHPTFNYYSLIYVRVFQKYASGSSVKHCFVLGRSACSLSAPWLPVVAAKWVGTCPVRVGWERVPPELGGNASRQQLCLCLFFAFWNVVFLGKCAFGCSGKHFFSLFLNDFDWFFMTFSWF